MEYKDNKGLQAVQSKDKRISFLSIFSSLCDREKAKETDHMQLFADAIEINEELYKKYPFPQDSDQEVVDAKSVPF